MLRCNMFYSVSSNVSENSSICDLLGEKVPKVGWQITELHSSKQNTGSLMKKIDFAVFCHPTLGTFSPSRSHLFTVFYSMMLCIVRTMLLQDVRLSGCLFIRLSHAHIVSKWLNILSYFFHRWVATPFWFFHIIFYGNIPMGRP